MALSYVTDPVLDGCFDVVPGLGVRIANTHALGRLITSEVVADTVLYLTSAAVSSMKVHQGRCWCWIGVE